MNDITKFTEEQLAAIEAYEVDLLMYKREAANLDEAKAKVRAMTVKRFGVEECKGRGLVTV